ncbi:hypothetical protein GCM10010350_40450 [Streptomyces galilaeus]|nr:hypothetical protein GCM10010350_40450 [Streptomyces galilaeus]
MSATPIKGGENHASTGRGISPSGRSPDTPHDGNALVTQVAGHPAEHSLTHIVRPTPGSHAQRLQPFLHPRRRVQVLHDHRTGSHQARPVPQP